MNTPETFVYDMCHGLAAAHPELEFVEKYKVVKKKDINDNKVSLISGGGSGHEPAHAGFVGNGMLDAAVCGDVFASPSQVQVYNAIKACATDKGVLLIVKNYSGDCMNFNNAMSDAQDDGIKVDAVYVNDDIAVKDSLYTVGRRGVAGTVLVHKCAGAAAEQGKSLEEVKAVANKVIDNVRSFGFAFTSCTVPAAGHPTFDIGDDEMEFGVGIHGEPGRFREKIDYSTGTFCDDLSRRIVTDLEEDLALKSGEEVVLLINGFGGTPLQELYILNNSVTKALAKDGVKIHKTIVGNFMTSIDMAGASISVLRVDSELKALVDYPVNTPALTWGAAMSEQAQAALEAVQAIGRALGYAPVAEEHHAAAKKAAAKETEEVAVYEVEGKPEVTETINTAAFVQIVDKMADVIIENEVPFCEADKMGDGDFGMSIAKGFKQLKADWATRKKGDIGQFLVSCSESSKSTAAAQAVRFGALHSSMQANPCSARKKSLLQTLHFSSPRQTAAFTRPARSPSARARKSATRLWLTLSNPAQWLSPKRLKKANLSAKVLLSAQRLLTKAQKPPRLTLQLSAERALLASVQSVIPMRAHTDSTSSSTSLRHTSQRCNPITASKRHSQECLFQTDNIDF